MVQGKTIVIGSVIAAGGTLGAIALYLMMKGQLQMPSMGAGANVSYGAGYGGMTAQQACAAKNWVWQGNQCVQYTSSSQNQGEAKNDKTPDTTDSSIQYQCCTGGGTVTRPSDCPNGNVKPNCPIPAGQEVSCPDYWSRATPPKLNQIVKVPAGSSCPGQDCGFNTAYTGQYGTVYGDRTTSFCPGTDLVYHTTIVQQQGNLQTGHGEHLLDPGPCPGSIDRADQPSGLPMVSISGPICLKVTPEDRSTSQNLAGQRSCGSYSAKTPQYICIAPGQSQTFRPQTASKPTATKGGRLSRLRITLVQPGQCSCQSSTSVLPP